MMVANSIVLFDLDGTLTPPRGEMTPEVAHALEELIRFAEVGIITGSSLDYIQEQCAHLFERKDLASNTFIYPCNGTQHYAWDETSEEFLEVMCNSMRSEIGEKRFRMLLAEIQNLQSDLINRSEIPLTGDFITYRKSMINWSPIGRNANTTDREIFVEIDKRSGLREYYLERLRDFLIGNMMDRSIEVVLGGETSFDIFPKGWDKSYIMKHIDPSFVVWFVGDRCTGNGNDRALYDIVAPLGRGFETKSPENTVEIIQKKIIPVIERAQEVEEFIQISAPDEA